MLFDEILATLKDNGRSSHAYEKVITHADKAMADDPDRAAGYRLLSALADRFLESTGRLPVAAAQTEKAYTDFQQLLTELKDAFVSNDPAQIVTVLNAVSVASREPLFLTSDLGN
jgi:hypothetical protein